MSYTDTIVHMLVTTVDPREGGMEGAVSRVAGFIGSLERTRVYLYTRSMSDNALFPALNKAYEMVNMHGEIQALHPLDSVTGKPLRSIDRNLGFLFDTIVFRNSVKERILSSPAARHVIMSFYLVGSGFLAQHVADEVGVQHIACVRGSDFSLHHYAPSKRAIYKYICRHASWIVTTNHTQEYRIGDTYGRRERISTIFNSISCDAAVRWRYQPKDYIQVVADSGYAVKKGTHLLLEAIRQLRSEGMDIRLMLFGALDHHNLPGRNYWAAIRERYRECDPCGFTFHDFVPNDQLAEHLLAGDIYCSASFSEGSSNALNRVMTIGMPIVATDTGSHGEMIGNASHVKLCPPGDLVTLVAAIRGMAEELKNGNAKVDNEEMERWQLELDPEKERQAWAAVLKSLYIN